MLLIVISARAWLFQPAAIGVIGQARLTAIRASARSFSL